MDKLQSRYVGARPFETNQQLIFRGRQADTEGFFKLIQLENLVVLYGKSGTGKSSLLNAGVMPKVTAEKEFIPLRVRFNAYREGNDFTEPMETTRLVVRGNVAQHNTFLDKLIPNEPTLWHDVKEHYILQGGEHGLLLVIDQFEELFTYPQEMIQTFQVQLAEALYKAVPQRYWDVLQSAYTEGNKPLSTSDLNLFQHKPALKVVLSIRSDRLHLLNRLDEQLPTILKNLYELDALDTAAAQQAIAEPAALPQMDVFDTAPFLYDQAALDHILDFLSHEKLSNLETEDSNLVANQQKIEATQLQIICDAIEKRVKARHLQIVQLGDVGNLEGIIEQYYDNQIHALDKSEQLPARRFIEEGLVFEEEERRLSLYEGQIFKTYKVKPETLQQLVDSHLLRAEPNMSGGYTYELSHDTLVTPVLKAKNLRLDAERKIADAEAKQERDAELAQARRLAEVERMRRRRSNIFLIIATIGLGIAIWQFIAATRAKEQAELLRQNFEQQKDDAYKAKGLAEAAQNAAIISDSLAQIAKLKADIAARQAKSAEQEANKQRDEAQKQKDIADKRLKEMQELQIAKYKTSAQRMVEMGKYKIARQILNEALKLDPLNEKVLAELKKLNN